MNARQLSIATLIALAGCGGGGSTGPLPTAVATQTTTAVPTPASSPAPRATATATPASGSTSSIAKLTLSFRRALAPASSARHPQYVSMFSSSLIAHVDSVNDNLAPGIPDSVVPFDFGPNGNCTTTNGIATCVVTIAAPVGNVGYTFSVLDSSNRTLSKKSTTFVMTQGIVNVISATLEGVVASVSFSATTLNADDTSLATTGEVVTVFARDASGGQIVDGTSPANFNNPFTIYDRDWTGQTALHLNGGPASQAVIASGPSDVITLTYTGRATNAFGIASSGLGWSTVGSTVQDIAFVGTTLDTAANGGHLTDPNYGQQTLPLASLTDAKTISVTELGWTDQAFGGTFDIALDAGCAGIATASAGPATTFTISAAGGVGICMAHVTEHGAGYPLSGHPATVAGSPTQDGTFWITVTSASITLI